MNNAEVKKYSWLISSGGVTYGAIVTAYVARINALGYTVPSATILAAMDTFFTSIGTTITAKFDVLYILAMNNAALQNAASLNLITPASYQMTYVNTPTYAAKGIMGNGSTSYAQTNFNPATNGVQYTLNAASRVFYLETIPTLGTSMEGALTTNTRNNTTYNAASTVNRINSGGNSLSAAVDLTGVGYKAIDRLDATNLSTYNELVKSDRTQSAVALLSEVQTLGKNGTAFSNSEFGIYGMGGHLTEAQHNTFRAAYLAYRTAIGL
jgi:hypothetical protein